MENNTERGYAEWDLMAKYILKNQEDLRKNGRIKENEFKLPDGRIVQANEDFGYNGIRYRNFDCFIEFVKIGFV